MIVAPIDLHHIPGVIQFIAGKVVAIHASLPHQIHIRQRIPLTHGFMAHQHVIGIIVAVGQIITGGGNDGVVQKQCLLHIRPTRIHLIQDCLFCIIVLCTLLGNLILCAVVSKIHLCDASAGRRIRKLIAVLYKKVCRRVHHQLSHGRFEIIPADLQLGQIC